MLVDELIISAKAGDGGAGVVRWHREKFKPMGGPSGGNGGRGGDVFVEAVADLNRLAKYTGEKAFVAESGGAGDKQGKWGRDGNDMVIMVPVGSRITDLNRERTFELREVGQRERILMGGSGGYGNEHFKSSTNRAPEEATPGRPGEIGDFKIELLLTADVGLVGLPNAGKSTLLNTLTNATARTGAYPFTTTEPHLGVLHEFVLADIPGLIEGAASGKGLGHKFLRHVSRTKMLVHLVSLENEDPFTAYTTVRNELAQHKDGLTDKTEWIILTKMDLVDSHIIEEVKKTFDKSENRVFVISAETGNGVKEFSDELVKHLRAG